MRDRVCLLVPTSVSLVRYGANLLPAKNIQGRRVLRRVERLGRSVLKNISLLLLIVFSIVTICNPAPTVADHAVRLTDNLGMEWSGVFSPDGESIAFVSNRSGLWAIWTISTTSASFEQITTGEEFDHDPDYSPDGQRLAIFSHGSGSGNDVYTIGAHGGTRVPLTNGGQNTSPDYSAHR